MSLRAINTLKHHTTCQRQLSTDSISAINTLKHHTTPQRELSTDSISAILVCSFVSYTTFLCTSCPEKKMPLIFLL